VRHQLFSERHARPLTRLATMTLTAALTRACIQLWVCFMSRIMSSTHSLTDFKRIALTNIALLTKKRAKVRKVQKAQEKRGSSRVSHIYISVLMMLLMWHNSQLVAAELGQCTGTILLALEIPLHRRTRSIHAYPFYMHNLALPETLRPRSLLYDIIFLSVFPTKTEHNCHVVRHNELRSCL
jgi:hypothetical protein